MLATLSEVCVRFERWGQVHNALVDISLQISEGEWVMVTGHNGSGKSTLLKVLSGQIKPTSGSMQVFSSEENSTGLHFASETYHVQQDPLLGTAALLTLRENLAVALPRSAMSSTRIERRRLVDETIDRLGMRTRANQLLRNFSGGERQQVALAIAHLRQPKLLLLDEPFAALDPQRISAAIPLISELAFTGSTVLQVTHDPSMASSYGHRTLVLENGQLISDLAGTGRSNPQTSDEATTPGL